MSESHGLQTDLHWSSDFTGSRTSISETIPSGKSLMDLLAIEVLEEEMVDSSCERGS